MSVSMSLMSSTRTLSMDNSDEVFSAVEATINPGYRKEVTNLEDVLVMIEEHTSVNIRFTRGNYVLIGRWEQVEQARGLLERSMCAENAMKRSIQTSDQDINSFELRQPLEKKEESQERGQEGQWLANINNEVLEWEVNKVKDSPGARVIDGGKQKDKDKENYRTKEAEQLPPHAKVEKSEPMMSAEQHQVVQDTEKMSDQKMEPPKRTEETAFSEQTQPVSGVEVTGMAASGAKTIKDKPKLDKEYKKMMAAEEMKDTSELLKDTIYSDIAYNDPIFVDQNIFEYLLHTEKLKAIRDSYNVDILLQNEQCDQPSVLIVATKGQSDAVARELTAREEFIGIYEKAVLSCVEEICDLREGKCAQEALAETILIFPDILMKQSGMKSNRFIFIGPSIQAKKCCHFFRCCVDELEKRKTGNPINTNLFSKFGLQLKEDYKTFQCEEARQIRTQATMSLDATEFGYSDLPDLESVDDDVVKLMENTLREENGSMARTKEDNSQETSTDKEPVVEVLESDEEDTAKRERAISQTNSPSDRQSEGGTGSPVTGDTTKPGVRSHQGDLSQKRSDAVQQKPELVTFKKQVFCGQCAGLGKEHVHLPCSHHFCVACVRNPSCVSDSCPDCGQSFSREALDDLWPAESGAMEGSLEAMTSSEQMAPRPGKVTRMGVSRSEVKPEMQQDGMDVYTSKGQMCPHCLLTYDWLIMLRCGHSYCYECLTQTNFPHGCPDCGKTIGKCVFNAPAAEICHEFQKESNLPAFPRDGILCVSITIPEGELKIDDDWSVKYPKASITTYLPQNNSGRQLYKNLVSVNKLKKLFEVVPVSRHEGLVVASQGVDLTEDQEAVTQEYMETISKQLEKFNKLA